MSRPDRTPEVGVDFAPPQTSSRTRPLVTLAVAVLLIGAVAVAVTQLLLR